MVDRDRFFGELAEGAQFLQAFDYLPDTQVFVKDRDGHFMHGNRASALFHSCPDYRGMLGKTDFDYHPPSLAESYVREDQEVMKSREPLPDQVWLVLDPDGVPGWYICTKIPLFSHAGDVVGLMGVMRHLERTGSAPEGYERLTPVMEMVLSSFDEPLKVAELAESANLSVSQLQREFVRLFGLSPMAYLQKVRLLNARRRLSETRDPLGEIALDSGFYDQSHFTRIFRAEFGMPPRSYRAEFGTG